MLDIVVLLPYKNLRTYEYTNWLKNVKIILLDVKCVAYMISSDQVQKLNYPLRSNRLA